MYLHSVPGGARDHERAARDSVHFTEDVPLRATILIVKGTTPSLETKLGSNRVSVFWLGAHFMHQPYFLGFGHGLAVLVGENAVFRDLVSDHGSSMITINVEHSARADTAAHRD